MNKDLRFYQAIETKFIGPTNSHGGKIKDVLAWLS